LERIFDIEELFGDLTVEEEMLDLFYVVLVGLILCLAKVGR
jgi:hypothetical protein